MPYIGPKGSSQWLSAHIFYAQSLNKVLAGFVKPFIEDILSRKLSEHYFFIRYHEKGPHIRLRIKEDGENRIRPLLISAFNEYIQHHLSISDDAIKKEDRLPDNSLIFIDYVPETIRYGGDEAIVIAERQFEISSKIALDLMSNGAWDEKEAFKVAIQLHIGLLHSFGYSIEEIPIFFKQFLNAYGYFFNFTPERQRALDSSLIEYERHFTQNNAEQTAIAQALV